MIARLWTTGIKPDRVDAYESFARDISLPMFRAQDGFIGCLMYRDDTVARVLTMWRDMAAVEALGQSDSYRATVARILDADILSGDQGTDVATLHLVEVDGLLSDVP
jgi:quinol monooxygenase YgiN